MNGFFSSFFFVAFFAFLPSKDDLVHGDPLLLVLSALGAGRADGGMPLDLLRKPLGYCMRCVCWPRGVAAADQVMTPHHINTQHEE